MNDVVIEVDALSKKYNIGAKLKGSVRETFTHKWNVLTGKTKNKYLEFWALKDVSFRVKKGEILGVIGKNGAGKSTLLKILSRITEPTSGKFVINGRVSSLLEVGTGFHPELTGRENVFLNGTILGMTRKEVSKKFDEIVQFSGVEKFIDTPVKHYSSGMYVRLAFSVAAYLEPEILIIDEILAVGDIEFQKKCLGKMQDVARSGRTVIFVSHDMNSIITLCNTGILLKDGTVKMNGQAQEVISDYLMAVNDVNYEWTNNDLSKPVRIQAIKVSLEGDQPDLILKVELNIVSEIQMKESFVAFNIYNGMGQIIGQSIPSLQPFVYLSGTQKKYYFEILLNGFVPDNYFLSAWVGPHFSHTYDWVKDVIRFQVIMSPQAGRTFPHPREHGSIVLPSKIVII